jgi:acylphosphatase
MDKHAEIIVYGRVQKAGFRDFIDEIAFHFNLNGYVKNLNDGTVQIICEGEENSIKELLEKINISQYPIRVENIDVVYKKPTGEYRTFEVIREEDLTTATYERMDAAVRYIREMNSDISQKIDGLGNNLGDKIDGLGDNIDTTLVVRSMGLVTRSIKTG